MNFELRPNSYRFSTKSRSRFTADSLVLEANFVTNVIETRLKVLKRRRVGSIEFMGETRPPYHSENGQLVTPACYFFHCHCYMEDLDGQAQEQPEVKVGHSS